MKIKDGFILKVICDENVIIPTGMENIDFNSIIALNESAAFAFKSVAGKDSFTLDDMVSAMLEEYEVDEDTARKDCEFLLEEWKLNKIIAE